MSLGVGEWAGEMRTWFLLFVIVAAVGVAAGCSSGSGSTSPTPIPTQSSRAGDDVLAFGDDFTVGIGTTSCGLVFGGECVTTPSDPGVSAAENPQGWAQSVAGYVASNPRWQPSTFVPLGVSGTFSGDAPKPEPYGDMLVNAGQFGDLTTIATNVRSTNIGMLVLIESGINDTLDAFESQQCTSGGGTVTGYSGGNYASFTTPSSYCYASGTTLGASGTLNAAFTTMLSDLNGLAGGAPEATVIVGVPNLGAFPMCLAQYGAGSPQCTALTADAQQANAAIQAAIANAADKNVVFADWYTYFNSNPSYYSTTYFASDNFHLDNQGYGVLATFVEQTILNGISAGTLNMSKATGPPAR